MLTNEKLKEIIMGNCTMERRMRDALRAAGKTVDYALKISFYDLVRSDNEGATA